MKDSGKAVTTPLLNVDKYVLSLYYQRKFTPEDLQELSELENAQLMIAEWGIFLHPVLGVKCFCNFPIGAQILLVMRHLPLSMEVVIPLYQVDKRYLEQILKRASKPKCQLMLYHNT